MSLPVCKYPCRLMEVVMALGLVGWWCCILVELLPVCKMGVTRHCLSCCLQVLSTRARKEVALADVKVQVCHKKHSSLQHAISAVPNST